LRHNGVLVYSGVLFSGPSLGGQPEGDSPGPIVLQDHGDQVQFRNIWLVEGTGFSIASSPAAGLASVDAEGFIRLFDGRTLSGWDGDPRYWSVEDGAITAEVTSGNSPSSNTCLVWRGGSLEDFELRLKYRIAGGNSGVQIRSEETAQWRMRGYQADFDAGGKFTGMVYDEGGRGILCQPGQKTMIANDGQRTVLATVSDSARIGAAVRDNDWNDMEITAQGVWILININGVRTAELNDQQFGQYERSGLLGLQLHAGQPMRVQFKDIRLKRL
jgi:hypothetical protein